MSCAAKRGLVGLLGATGVSLLGTRMSLLALPWFVLTLTGSPTLTGLAAAAELTPYVLVQALGGPLVDRLGARRASVTADLGAAVFIGLVPALHALGALPLVGLLLLVAVTGALRGAGDSARDVMVPGVAELGGTPLERAAGLFDGVNRTASLVGAPLAGVLVQFTSAVNVLALDAATFAVSALLVSGVVPRAANPPARAADDPSAPESYLASLREGFAYLRADRLLLGIGAMVLITNLIDQAAGSVLIPSWAQDVAGSPVALGLLGGAFSLGAVTGNVAMTWLGPRVSRYWAYSIGFLLGGGPRLIALGLAANVSPVLAVTVIAGLGAGGLNPILGAVEYERVPRHLQARVLGAVGATAWAGMPLGGILGGVAVETLGVQPALLLAGGCYLLTTVAPFVFPVWRQMERRPASRDDEPGVESDARPEPALAAP